MSVLLVLLVVIKFALTPTVATIAHVTLVMCYQEMEKLALVCISDNHLLMYANNHTHELYICTDIDECATDNGGCAQWCNNTDGSYECICGPGFILNNNGKTCNGMT